MWVDVLSALGLSGSVSRGPIAELCRTPFQRNWPRRLPSTLRGLEAGQKSRKPWKQMIRFGIFEPWKFVTWTFHGMSHFLGKELDQRCVRCVHWSCQVNSNQTFWHLHEPVRPLTSVSSTVRSADSFHLSSLTVHVALMERLAMTRFPSRGPLQQSTWMLILCGSWLKAFHHCWIIES